MRGDAMNGRRKKIFCIIATITMLIGILPPLPVRSDPITATLYVGKGVITLIDVLVNGAGGVAITSFDTCACIGRCMKNTQGNCRSIRTTCVCTLGSCMQSLQGYQCATSTLSFNLGKYEFDHRHNPVIRELAQPSNAHLFNAIQEAGSVLDNAINTSSVRTREIQFRPITLSCGRVVSSMPVPYVPTAISRQDLFGLLNSMTDVLTAAAEGVGYRWCFINQDFRPFPISTPNPFLLGFCSVTGLPIIDTTRGFAIGSDVHSAVKQNALQSFEFNGQVRTIIAVPSQVNQGRWRLGYVIDGEIRTPGESPGELELLGFIIQSISGGVLENFATAVFEHQSWSGTARMISLVNAHTPQRETQVTASPQDRPAAGTVTLAQTNMITDSAGVIAEIGAIAGNPATYGDDVILMNPVLTPEAFPGISAEDFPALAQAIIDALGINDVIMTGAAVKELSKEMDIPRIDMDKPAVPPIIDLSSISGILNTIIGILQAILNAIRALPNGIIYLLQRILDFLATIADAIALAIVGTMVLDYSPLEELRAFNGVFPFSIPWDLRNAFLAMFGGSVSPRPAPVFEIDLTDTVFNYNWKLEFSEYESMVVVIRWGIMGLFVAGLVMATSKLIQW
jgi:hypothetical protein